MTIWQNRRADEFERAAEGGDLLRGQPAIRLPLEVGVFSHTDAENDRWTLRFLCDSLAPSPQNATEVLASILVRATCPLSAERLGALGFNASRLDALAGSEAWRTLEQTWRFEARTTVDDLEKVAAGAVGRVTARIDRSLASARTKREGLRDRLRRLSFSGFASGEE